MTTERSHAPVTVSVVSFDAAAYLERCLRALDRYAGDLVRETIVVDNASRDGSVAMVRERFPHVRLIANDANRGFGAGHNQALANTTSPFVLVLNDDAELTAGALRTMVAAIEADERRAMIGPKLTYEDGVRQPSPTGAPSVTVVLLRMLGLKRLVPRALVGGLVRLLRPSATSLLGTHGGPLAGVEPPAGAAESLSGACMLVRVAALAGGPLFDERYFMYLEDADLCRSLRARKWELYYEPAAVVVHHVGRSSPAGYRRTAQPLRSLVLYFRKNHGRRSSRVVKTLVLASLGVELAGLLVASLLPGTRRRVAQLIRSRWEALGVVFAT